MLVPYKKKHSFWHLLTKFTQASQLVSFFIFFAPEIRTRKSPHYFLNIPKCIYFNFANVHGYMVE